MNKLNEKNDIQTYSYISATKSQKIIMMFPMIILQLYLSVVVLLYIFGPWEWPTHKPILFYSLLLLYQLAFGMGYLLSIKKKSNIKNNFSKKSLMTYLRVMIVLNLIYTIINYMHTVGINSISINSIIDHFLEGIMNPAAQYQMKFNATKFGGSIFTYFSVITAPLFWPVIPLSIYFFKELTLSRKLMLIITVFFELLRWIAIGTSKGIFDLIILLLVVTLIKYIQKNYYLKRQKNKTFNKLKFRFLVLLLIIIGLAFFSNNVGDRVNENWSNYSTTNGNVKINNDSLFMSICPNGLKPTLIYLTSYLTQGYYAFSIALDLDFKPLFGIGNSMFLMENFKEIFEINLYDYTYQARMSVYGWHPYVNWHSFYVWAANDVHFLGVIIIMYLIGYLFGHLYKDVIIYSNPLALPLLCLFFMLMIYLPANNQVLSYPTTFVTFWTLLIYWMVRKKYKIVW